MNKIINIIIVGLFIVFSILLLLMSLELLKIQNITIQIVALIYIAISAITVVLLSRKTKKQIKEEVRIVYKETSEKKEKTTEQINEQKEGERIIQYSNQIIDGINKNAQNAEQLADSILKRLAKVFNIVQGYFFLWDKEKQVFRSISTYAYFAEDLIKEYHLGEGIVGQVAKDKRFLLMDNVPKDYINVLSGLGKGSPRYLAFIPIIYENQTVAVIEVASFEAFPTPTNKIFDSIARALHSYVVKFI